MSWTGSELQRRPQGVCLPPATTSSTAPRYLLPAGTQVEVANLHQLGTWKPHTIRSPIGFERYESREGTCLIFRHEGWLIKVPHHKALGRTAQVRQGQTMHLSLVGRRETRPRW